MLPSRRRRATVIVVIVVFDKNGSTFKMLRDLDLGVALWRVTDAGRLEHIERVELAIVAAYAKAPWGHLPTGERPVDTVIVSASYNEDEAFEALSRGMAGYLDARADPKALRLAVRGCLAGEPGYSPRVLGRWLRSQSSCARAHCSASRLTERQREVMHLVAQGLTDKEIGERLGITKATAQKHLTNILERLNVPNRAAAAATICSVSVDEPLLATPVSAPIPRPELAVAV